MKLIQCTTTPPHSPSQEVESQPGRDDRNSSPFMDYTTISEQWTSPKSPKANDTMTHIPNVHGALTTKPNTPPFGNDLSSILYESDNNVSMEENTPHQDLVISQ